MSDPTKDRQTMPALVACVYACFFLSGVAGLIYEIAWMRALTLVLGHTADAITVVVGAFMGGLALGARLFGRLIDNHGRPLTVYGLLEAGVAGLALAVPTALKGIEWLYPALSRGLDLPPLAVRLVVFLAVTAILILPTTLMGATLPVLSKLCVTRLDGLGRKVGDLYALNTLGAVAGAGATGFVLLPLIGTKAATLLAVGLNLAIAVIALLVDRLTGAARPRACPESAGTAASARVDREPGAPRLLPFLVLVGIGLSGAVSMIYEIAWTRALTLVIGSSTYAFSAMLTTFLFGLALGSFLFARIWGKRNVGPELFGALEMAAGFAALALVSAFQILPDVVLWLIRAGSLSRAGVLASQFGASFLVMIVPTALIGATLPCVAHLCARSLTRLGREVGRVYAVNTVGTVFGAFAAGLFVLPWIGARQAMVWGAALNVGIGAVVLAAAGPRRLARPASALLSIGVFVALVALLPSWDPRLMAAGVSVYGPRFLQAGGDAGRFRADVASRELLFYSEGVNATVSVERTPRGTFLRVDGKVDAGNALDMMTQLMLGHLPMFLHPGPERVLVIGLGSGVTAGAVAQHPVKRIDVVEIEPAVVEAARFFARENRGVLQDPRVRVITADARQVMLAGDTLYDVISSEPSNPWMAGVANLFSREFYELARRRLAPDGVVVQWIHGYSLFPPELRTVVNTFRGVFPHTTVWRTVEGDYLLVGTRGRLTVDFTLLNRRYEASPAVRDDLAILGWRSPLALLTLFFLDEDDAARYADGGLVNTDDRPLLEFAAPLALYAWTVDENYQALKAARRRQFPPIVNVDPAMLQANWLAFARAFWTRAQRREALEHLAQAPAGLSRDQRFERARLFFALGRVAPGIEDLSELARREPGNRLYGAYIRAGTMLLSSGFEQALHHHAQTASGKPNPAEAHNNLGLFYNALGIRTREEAFFDLAIDAFEAALAIEPAAYPLLNNLGNAYFEKGRLDDAAEVYREVLRAKPDLALAHFNLALVHERQGALKLAAEGYRKALQLGPGWDLPRRNLQRLGRPDPPQK